MLPLIIMSSNEICHCYKQDIDSDDFHNKLIYKNVNDIIIFDEITLPFYSWHGCGGLCFATIYVDRVEWIDFMSKHITIYFNNIKNDSHRHNVDSDFIIDEKCTECYKDYDHSRPCSYEIKNNDEFNDYLAFKDLMLKEEIQSIKGKLEEKNKY